MELVFLAVFEWVTSFFHLFFSHGKSNAKRILRAGISERIFSGFILRVNEGKREKDRATTAEATVIAIEIAKAAVAKEKKKNRSINVYVFYWCRTHPSSETSS